MWDLIAKARHDDLVREAHRRRVLRVARRQHLARPRMRRWRRTAFAEAAEAIATGAAIPVEFTPVPQDAWISALRAEGVPPEVVELLTHLFTEVLDGRNGWVGDGVSRALGRPPKSFATYVTEATSASAWT